MPQTIFVRKPTYKGPPAKTSSILDDSPKRYPDRNLITHSYLDSVIFLPSKMKLEEKVKKDSKLSKIACVKVQTVYFWGKHHESFLNWLMMTKEWILFNLYQAAIHESPDRLPFGPVWGSGEILDTNTLVTDFCLNYSVTGFASFAIWTF